MTARDPVQKEMATEKKQAKINQAELDKQAAREHNTAAKQSATAGHMGTGTGTGSATYSTTGTYGQPMGAHQTSALPGHGGTDGTATAHNTRVGGNPNASGYGTGGTYS